MPYSEWGNVFREPELKVLLTQSKYPVRNVVQNINDLKAQIAANEKGVTELKKMIGELAESVKGLGVRLGGLEKAQARIAEQQAVSEGASLAAQLIKASPKAARLPEFKRARIAEDAMSRITLLESGAPDREALKATIEGLIEREASDMAATLRSAGLGAAMAPVMESAEDPDGKGYDLKESFMGLGLSAELAETAAAL